MNSIGTSIGEGINKYSGLSLLDSGLSKFTNKEKFDKVSSNLNSGTSTVKINNTTVPVIKSDTGTLTTAFNSSITTIDNTLNIKKYTVPTKLALDAFENMGRDIDKSLSESFVLQTLNIKGTDILCSVFCFLISMLSCKERGDIYDALKKANDFSRHLAESVKAVNNTVNAVGAIMASGDAIAESAKNLFGGSQSSDIKGNVQTAIAATATLAAAPATILANAKLIGNIFKLAGKHNLALPNVATLTIWDMSSNILHALQSQALQGADEVLSKLTSPIEEKIKQITPQPCFGAMTVRLQQSIINAIERFKQWILSQIADLFVGNANFNINFIAKLKQSSTALEMIAITNALTILSAHFLQIANSCGISPCNENNPTNTVSRDANKVSNIGQLDAPRYTNTIFVPPITANNIDDIAKKLSPTMGADFSAPQIFVTPEEILAIHNIPIADMPRKIKELIEKGALNPNLDSNYTVHINPDAINVVYRYDKKCGE